MIPDRKVSVGAFAGAVTVVLIYFARAVGEIEIPGEVGAAITMILTALVSYMVPNPKEKTP